MKASPSLRRGLARCRLLLRNDLHTQITQDSLLVLSGHLARLALGLISSALLARGLGPEGLSLFSVVGAVLSVAITVADFGLGNSAVRQIAGEVVSRVDQAHATAGAYARLKVLGGLTGAALIVAFAGPVGDVINLPAASQRTLIGLLALGLIATTVSGMATTLLRALRRFRAMVAVQLANIGATVVLVGGLFLLGQLTVVSVLVVGALAALVAAGLGILLLPPDWRAALFSGRLRGRESWRLLAFGKWLWISAILSILSSQLDLLLLNRWLAPSLVGIYALALNLAFKADIVNQTLHTVLLPAASGLSSRQEYVDYVRRSLVRSLLLGTFFVLALPLARPFIVTIYGVDYAASVNVFYLLMIVVLFDLFTMPILLLAFPMDIPRLIAAADGIGVAVLLVAGMLLIPTWGIAGAVVAKLAAKASAALVLGVAVAWRLRTDAETATDDGRGPDTDTAPSRLPPEAR